MIIQFNIGSNKMLVLVVIADGSQPWQEAGYIVGEPYTAELCTLQSDDEATWADGPIEDYIIHNRDLLRHGQIVNEDEMRKFLS